MRKILKYDFLDNYLGIFFIDILVCCCILIMGFFSQEAYAKYLISDMVSMICFITLVIGCFLWVIFMILAVLDSINKKLFSSEGYLTFSLPLGIDSILLPKILINVFWVGASFVLLFLSLYINTFWSHFGMMNMIFTGFASGIIHHPFWAFLAYVNFLFWVGLFLVKFLLVLGILNIGKIKKHRLIVGIVVFIFLQIILEIIKNQFSIFAPSYEDFYNNILTRNTALYTQGYGIQILINAAEFFVIYLITRYLIKNKLELE